MTVRQLRKMSALAPALAFMVSPAAWNLSAQQATDPTWLLLSTNSIDREVQKLRMGFIVYEDQDSGHNHGTFSGFFGSPSARDRITIDTGCVPMGNPPVGCASAPNTIDKDHGTVIRFTFPPLTGTEFAGVSCVEPEGLFVGQSGFPYDLRGIARLSFDAMSPDASNGMRFQFGFGGSTAPFRALSGQWERITIELANQTALTDLQNTSILFTIVANALNAPAGGTVLVDNIRFDPTPAQRVQALGFPAAYGTYGVVPVKANLPGPILIPPDQLFRNQAPLDAVAWAASVLTAMGQPFVSSARMLLDSFVYETANPNRTLAPPPAQDGTSGLLSCFSSGDVGLKNDSGGARAGTGRPCGFSVGTDYRVVLDGATGGQNAVVILALLRGFAAFKDDRYLSTARGLANWIQEKLADPSTQGFGGYYYGYQFVSQSGKKEFLKSKTTVDNALIFSAFSALADALAATAKGDSDTWRSRATAAGQFVKAMYRPDGRFYSGTVPDSQPTDLDIGIRADGPRRGTELANSYDVIGNYTVVPLALFASESFRSQFDLSALMKNLLSNATTVAGGGVQFAGFFSAERIVPPNGVDWISTGTAALALRLAARTVTSPDVQTAAQMYLDQYSIVEQLLAVGNLIPAATLNNERAVEPYAQCLVSPFGCQPARPSIGATILAIASAKQINPFAVTETTLPPPSQPVIAAVVNAANFLSGSIAPGEIVTLFGTNMGPATPAGAALDLDGKVSTSSGGVQVLVGGVAAPMIYASSTQVSAVVPYEIIGSSNLTVQLRYLGQASNSFPVTVASTAPGLFTANGSGKGAGAILNQDNSVNSPGNPAIKGNYVVLYLTGEGQTNPPGITGKVNNVTSVQELPVPVQPVSVMIDGQPASFAFAGEAPTFVSGLMQVNAQIPLNAKSGNLSVVVSVGVNSSQTGVTVSVR